MNDAAPRRIWLCADDYGLSPGVNRAIRDLIERGRLNATSVMVVAPAIGRAEVSALQAAAAKSPRCAIGLHVTLTAPFRPLTMHFKPIDGGMIVQQPDPVDVDRGTWRVVTRAQPTESQWDDLVFAWQVCAAVSSNAIVYAKDLQAFGIGAGQQNRLDSARIAAERAAGRAVGGVCASDAFFPFRDGLDAAAAAGIAAVIQPGGSVRDDEVIAAADEHAIAMVFTAERHFRH